MHSILQQVNNENLTISMFCKRFGVYYVDHLFLQNSYKICIIFSFDCTKTVYCLARHIQYLYL